MKLPALNFGSLKLATPLLLVCMALAIGVEMTRAETPTEAVDRVWNAFAHLDPHRGSDNFPPEFWKLSRKVAREQGLKVIAPIMARSKDWKGEEGLIFVMLMVSLPSDQSIPVLEKYRKDGKPWEQQAAIDFLIEIKEGYPEELKAMSEAQRKKFLEETSP
jgi:hypothetical protein